MKSSAHAISAAHAAEIAAALGVGPEGPSGLQGIRRAGVSKQQADTALALASAMEMNPDLLRTVARVAAVGSSRGVIDFLRAVAQASGTSAGARRAAVVVGLLAKL